MDYIIVSQNGKLVAKTLGERELILGPWRITARAEESIGARYDRRRKLLQAVKLYEGDKPFVLFILGKLPEEEAARLIPERVRGILINSISYQVGRGLDAYAFGTFSEVKAEVAKGANFRPLWHEIGTDALGIRYYILAGPQ